MHFALASFEDSVQGKSVKWHSDNQGPVRIVHMGRPNAELYSVTLDIFDFCRNFSVRFVPQGVPRELNACAGVTGSNIIDFDNWSTTQRFSAHLDLIWGPHTVDGFANVFSAHLPRFNSWFRVPGIEAVDAL